MEEKRNKIVIVGAGGRLGAALAREYAREFDVIGFNHAQLDLGAPEQLRSTLGDLDFDALINAAAQTNVDRCETHQDEAFALNAEAPRVLAEICRARNARFIHISTDYVFDGEKPEPYTEEDEAQPISVYGESKREGERRALEANDRALIVRVSWIFGPDRPSFIDAILKKARDEEAISAVADKFATPTYTLDLARMLEPFFWSRRAPAPKGRQDSDPIHLGGLMHLANGGECSWQEYAQWALDCCHAKGVPMKAAKVGAATLAEMTNFIARRPVYSVLATGKYENVTGETPRPWRDAVAAYVRDHVM
ncbi:MAG: dTDP-4-dehydrorhamnose reductase [Verrucomicrobiota bacterium]|jgi:dTDP-4-dehydrorhamnose reductase